MANQEDQDILKKQNELSNYLNNEIKKLHIILYDIEENSTKETKPSKVSYAKPPKEKENKKDEVNKKDEKSDKKNKDGKNGKNDKNGKHEDKKSKNKKPEIKDKKTEITERLQELKRLKEAKEQEEASVSIKSLDELLSENANVCDFYNERSELSDSEKEFYKKSIQTLNSFMSQSFDDAINNLITYYHATIKQLEEDVPSFEAILKEKQKIMRENEELLKTYKSDYLEKKEKIYEAKEAVHSSAAISLPQLKEQYDTLNRNIPSIRNEFNRAKEADISHRKKIDKYIKEIENITNIFINKESLETSSIDDLEKIKDSLNEGKNDVIHKLETFEEEDWD